MPRRVRIGVAWAVILAGLALVALVFWRVDLRYLLPTPRPAGLV